MDLFGGDAFGGYSSYVYVRFVENVYNRFRFAETIEASAEFSLKCFGSLIGLHHFVHCKHSICSNNRLTIINSVFFIRVCLLFALLESFPLIKRN